MSTHTPGPWKASNNMVAAWGRVIAECDTGTWNDIEETEANARLIAAAPDLLEALKALLAHAEDIEKAMSILGQIALDPHSDKASARAAIAKAEGRS